MTAGDTLIDSSGGFLSFSDTLIVRVTYLLTFGVKLSDEDIAEIECLKVICNDFLVVKVNCWSHALI